MRRRHRLRHAADIQLLHQQGRRFHDPLLVLVIRANGSPASRFGFSAGRQVGKAVARNRAKRLMRESVRSHQDRIAEGWDCLFVARRGAAEASLDQMDEAIRQVLLRAQMMRDSR